MKKVALLLNREMADSIFTAADLDVLRGVAEFEDPAGLPERMTQDYMLEHIAGADACVTCWGTPALTPAMLAAAPDLRLVAHAAGIGVGLL